MMAEREIMTIDRHIAQRQAAHPGATGELSNILYDIALAGKLIAREVGHAGLTEILGMAGSLNVQGEEQRKLDLFANDIFKTIMTGPGRVAALATEEDEELVPVGAGARAKYVLVLDPLDGSSNTDVNVGTATIFGIYRRFSLDGAATLTDVLQPGRRLVAAGFILYGPSTMLVYSAGEGVYAFTLEPTLGEFLLSHPQIHIPAKPRYYSVNQGYQRYWSRGTCAYTEWLQGLDPSGKPPSSLSSRYIGSLAADFYRNLLEGGIYFYPRDSKDPALPDGKLRLVYEAAPLAFLAEQAGGAASDGRQPILDLAPQAIHQRTPLFIGSSSLVAEAESFLSRLDR